MLSLQEALEATFNDAPPPGYVRREGLIFKIGDYPDKKFSLSEEEADRAVAQFTPVPGDLEHTPTVLSGKVGILRSIRRDGQALYGNADVPEWLHGLLDTSASSISCAWDRATKKLTGWGWVLDPAVSDAALFNAYAQFTANEASKAEVPVNTPVTQPNVPTQTPQTPTNHAQFDGLTQRQIKERRFMPLAESIKKYLTATFSTGQQQPTPTPEPPVTTTTTSTPAPLQTPTSPAPTTATPTPVQAPASVPAATPTAPTTGVTPGSSVSTPTATVNPATTFSAPGVHLEPMDEATADFRAQQVVSRAREAADALISEGHIYSAGRSAAIAAFTAAGYDNEANGPSIVTFARSDGTVVNDRVELLKEMMRNSAKHSLFSKTLPVNVMNGNRAVGESKTAEQAGAEQAAAFNKQMGDTILANIAAMTNVGATTTPGTNGNGTH